MKKLILLFSLLPAAMVASAQSELPELPELPADSIQRSPSKNYKEYGGFLLDMRLMSVLAPKLPTYDLGLDSLPKDYNRLFTLDPNATVTQGFGTLNTSFRFTPQQWQMGSFKLKNGMRLNTYGEYNAEGYKVRNYNALPWEKNNFKGAFEMKSANGAFGIRIEVQQGRNNYPY